MTEAETLVREALAALRAADLAHMRAAGLAPHEQDAAGNTAGLSTERARPFPSPEVAR
ncbi:hypothetical protein ACFQ0K_08650 [Nocardioides caeni]|uniref:hypothetical protein n=1 Tax=Nocardioides caeni TaxID=574700 RepID=UPI0013050DA1|nr:hypothetical protein [Nocardioides caeni]